MHGLLYMTAVCVRSTLVAHVLCLQHDGGHTDEPNVTHFTIGSIDFMEGPKTDLVFPATMSSGQVP